MWQALCQVPQGKYKCFMRIHAGYVFLILLWNFPDREESSGVQIWGKSLFSEHTYTRLSLCIIPDSSDNNYFELFVPSPIPNQAALTQFPCSQSRSLEPPLSPTTHTDQMDPDIGLTEKKESTEALLPQQLPGGMTQHNPDQWEKMVGANKFIFLFLFLPHLPPVPTPWIFFQRGNKSIWPL